MTEADYVQENLFQSKDLQQVDEEVKYTDRGLLQCSQRWILFYMGFFFGLLLYIFRTNLSVAIVCMVKPPSETYLNITDNHTLEQNQTYLINTTAGECARVMSAGTTNDDNAEFEWDKTTQSMLLSAFYYGYAVTQVPGSLLSGRFGGKQVIALCMFVSSILTALVPVFARTHVMLVFTSRLLLGIFSGIPTPSWFSLVGCWALNTERSRFVAVFWMGQTMGTVLGFTTSGFLCTLRIDNGWPVIFYIHGIIGFVFVVAWLYFVYNNPDEHPRITESEQNLLASHLKTLRKSTSQQFKIPWMQIVTSRPLWVVYLAHIANNWLVYVLLTCLPLFLSEVLNFDITNNGLFSSLPYVSLGAGLALAGMLADFIITRAWLSTTNTRKLFQCSGQVGAAIFIIVSGYISCENRELVIVCLCLCTFIFAFGEAAGYTCNLIDITPRYSSVIFAISNTLASIPGILSPMAEAAITKSGTSQEWRLVFFICAWIELASAIVYAMFATSKQADWDTSLHENIIVKTPLQENQSAEIKPNSL